MNDSTNDEAIAKVNGRAQALKREIEERTRPTRIASWVEEGWRAKKHEIVYTLADGDRLGDRYGLGDTHDGTPLGRAGSRVRIFEALLHALKVRQGDPKAVALAAIGDDQAERIGKLRLTDEDLGGDLDV